MTTTEMFSVAPKDTAARSNFSLAASEYSAYECDLAFCNEVGDCADIWVDTVWLVAVCPCKTKKTPVM